MRRGAGHTSCFCGALDVGINGYNLYIRRFQWGCSAKVPFTRRLDRSMTNEEWNWILSISVSWLQRTLI